MLPSYGYIASYSHCKHDSNRNYKYTDNRIKYVEKKLFLCVVKQRGEFFFCNTVPQQPNNIVQVQLYLIILCGVWCLILFIADMQKNGRLY